VDHIMISVVHYEHLKLQRRYAFITRLQV